MADELKIVISAQDNASPAFKKIADAANKVADELEKAGKDGGKGFDELGKSARTADAALLQISSSGSGVVRSLNDGESASERFANGLLKLGSGLQSVGEALDGLGQSSIDQQRQILALNQLYGESSQQFQDFAKTIQNTTIFSDDQVRQAEIYFGTLKNNYDITDEQIQRLIQVSADLATIHGMSLEDASMRIQSAIRGEAEAAEALGLTMNQQSIDRNNLTLTMTNQEAAQFRLNALWEQTANVTGASTQYVQTANGQWQQFKNTMQDAGQTVGAVVGPFGDVFSTLGRGVSTLGDAARGFTEIKSVLSNVGAGMTSLVAAGGGVTLVIGSIAAALGAGIYVWNEYNKSIHSTEEAFKSFDAAEQQAILNGQTARAAAIEQAKNDFNDFGAWLDSQMTHNQSGAPSGIAGVYDETYNQALASVSKALQDSRVDVQAYTTWLEGELARAYQNPAQAQQIFEGIIETSTNNLGQFAIAANSAATGADQLSSATDKAAAAQAKLNAEMAKAADAFGHPDDKATPWSQDAIDTYNKTLQETLPKAQALKEQLAATPGNDRDLVIAQQRLSLLREEIVTQDELKDAYTDGARTGDYSEYLDLGAKRIEQQQMLLDLQNQLNKATEYHPKDVHDYPVEAARQLIQLDGQREALAEGVTGAIEKQRDAYRDMVDSFAGFQGLDSRVMAYGMTSFADEAARAGIAMQSVQSGLETTFRIVVENTQGVSDLADKTLKWGDELIGAEGTAGKIDDLLARGLITQQQYTDAQQAYNTIAEDTKQIQDDTLRIQTAQAPIIAQQTEALEKQYHAIADMKGEAQLAALGWMDSADAAKALEINAMAADVATGKMGASGKAGFEEMLQAAVLMDPALGAMLDKMGLIKLAADGTTILEINYDQAKGAESEIAKLTDSINALILALGGIPPFDVDTLSLMTAEQRVKALTAQIAELRRTGKLDDVKAQLDATFGDGSPIDSATERTKKLNQALIDLAAGKHVDLDTSGIGSQLQTVADVFHDLDGMTARPKVDADTSSAKRDLEDVADLLRPIDGKTFEAHVKVLVDGPDETGGGMGSIGRFGGGGSGGFDPIHIPTVLDAPTEQPDYSQLGPAHIPVQLDFDGSKYDQQNSPGSSLPGGGEPITIKVAADVSDAVIGLYNVQTQADTLAGTPVDLAVTADVADAVIGLYNLQTQADELASTDATLTIMGDATVALAAIDNVNSAPINDKLLTIGGDNSAAMIAWQNVANLPDLTRALTMTGDNGDAMKAWQAVADLPDLTKTVTFNIVTNGSVPSLATAHGGLLHYANGGLIPHIAGEGNRPEIAHYANGGMAVLPTEGLYFNPPNTYISPAPANPGVGSGGPNIAVVIQGNVIGVDDLETRVGSAVVQAMAEEARRERRAMGVTA